MLDMLTRAIRKISNASKGIIVIIAYLGGSCKRFYAYGFIYIGAIDVFGDEGV